MYQNSTTELDSVLQKTNPEDIDEYLKKQKQDLADEKHPFASYMRELLKEKGITQQEVFLKADIPEKYGYRLIAESKKTKQRDYILRICLAAGFTLAETQRALKLYGMTELYSRVPRDAVLMVAVNTGVHEIEEVNRMLREHEMDPLQSCAGRE